jgi:hypothetical protein
MAPLRTKIQHALDEARILVLGAQVLLGFAFRALFEQRFEGLPEGARLVKLGALCVLVVGFALIVLPGAYHRIAANGEDRPDVHEFATAVLGVALLPIALGLGLDVGVSVRAVLGTVAAAAAGTAATGLAAATWYGFTAARRGRRPAPAEEEVAVEEKNLSEKIRHVLTEVRMVLPGAQALLGFQLAAILTAAFPELPRRAQLVHLGSLGAIAVAVVLLITPAAYHRIVERGEETEEFHRLAGRFVIAAMVALAVGLSADVYVAFRKVLRADGVAVAAAIAALAVFLGLWFGVTLAARARHRALPAPRRPAGAHP